MNNSKTRSVVNQSTRVNLLKTMFLGCFFLIAFSANSQKVKIKDEIATVDGTPYVSVTSNSLSISIYELDSTNELIFVQYLSYNDPTRISSANPEGKVRWIEIKFLTLDLKCEIDSRGQKGVVKELYLNDIFVDGHLNEENAKKMVKKFGTSYSDNKPSSVIIYNR